MSGYFHENLSTVEDPLLEEDLEASLRHAFRRVLELEVSDAYRDELLDEARAEGILYGIGLDRINEIYIDLLTGQREE